MQVLMWLAHQERVTLRLLWLAWPALLLYAWLAYTAISMYVNSWGLPPQQALGRAIIATCQLLALLAVAIMDSCRYLSDHHIEHMCMVAMPTM